MRKKMTAEQLAVCTEVRREEKAAIAAARAIDPAVRPRLWAAMRAQTQELIRRGEHMYDVRNLYSLSECANQMRIYQPQAHELRSQVDAQGAVAELAGARRALFFVEMCVSCADSAIESCARAADELAQR